MVSSEEFRLVPHRLQLVQPAFFIALLAIFSLSEALAGFPSGSPDSRSVIPAAEAGGHTTFASPNAEASEASEANV
ncbi:MAG: hypothetical protein ACREF8_05060, partial [Chthoniobacterales bacterium]